MSQDSMNLNNCSIFSGNPSIFGGTPSFRSCNPYPYSRPIIRHFQNVVLGGKSTTPNKFDGTRPIIFPDPRIPSGGTNHELDTFRSIQWMSYLMKFQLLKSWRKMTKHLMNHSFLHRNHHQSPWCHWNYYGTSGTSGTASRARTRSHAATSTVACGAWHAPSAWKSAMCLSGRNLWDDWDDGNLVALSENRHQWAAIQ